MSTTYVVVNYAKAKYIGMQVVCMLMMLINFISIIDKQIMNDPGTDLPV